MLTSIVTALTMLAGYSAAAQTTGPLLSLAPHCILPERSACPKFSIRDAKTLQTDSLKAGDILDIDIVVVSDTPQDITTVRSWLDYDPALLEARSVELLSPLSIPLPGEQSIDSPNGVIKIGGSTKEGLPSGDTAVARVTFRILSSATPGSIRFHNYAPGGSGETSISRSVGTVTTPLLAIAPPSLTIAVAGTGEHAAAVSSSAAGAVTAQSSFTLLQTQNLRVTTKDNDLFLGWDPLMSSQLAGYNVYYGNTSGRYLQRRSIGKSSTSLVLRDLDVGKQYFIAIRGFDASNQESAFSQEVGIVVGRPETSTAPLDTTPFTQAPPQGNPVQAHGGTAVTESGVGSDIALICLVSACIGTAFAWRRQSMASSHSSHV